MWIYIILLAVMIAGLWLVFFKKEVAMVFRENKVEKEKSLGEIFGAFGQSVSQGVKVFSEIKNQLPETPVTSINETTTADNLAK